MKELEKKNLSKQPKKTRHISRRRNVQQGHKNSKSGKQELENKVLISRLDQLKKTFRKIKNISKGPKKKT